MDAKLLKALGINPDQVQKHFAMMYYVEILMEKKATGKYQIKY